MREEKVLYDASVCFLYEDGKILLAFKTDKIGKDCWNGYGGGIEPGETPEECAIRELFEESGKNVVALTEDLKKIAEVDFHNTKTDGTTFICKVHFFLVKKWEGRAKSKNEMINPTWFRIDYLPVERMMPADSYWLPAALAGQKMKVKARLGPYQKKLLSPVEITFVDSWE